MTTVDDHAEFTRDKALTAAELRARGKAARARMPRSAQADFTPPSDRDPVDILRRQHEHRVPELVPLRLERMTANPFAFYRGSAAVQVADLRDAPRTGADVTICGDAHVANFGIYAAPDRSLVFDLNDFDEAAFGPWEWDVKRLVASVVLAGRQRGFEADDVLAAAQGAAAAYRNGIREFTQLSALDRYYVRSDVQRAPRVTREASRKMLKRVVKGSDRRTSDRVARKITQIAPDGRRMIVEDPPVLTHVPGATEQNVLKVLDKYLKTAPPDIAVLLSQYVPIGAVRRVVGVGSVGTRCFIVVLTGPAGEDLILQVKEATQSVAVEFGHASGAVSPSISSHERDREHGHRVVANQRVLQAASDPFLGWTRIEGFEFYVRQFRDRNTSIDTDTLDFPVFCDYVAACALVLARAHAQSPNALFIDGYLGNSTVFDTAVAAWSIAYADQAVADYETVKRAVADGSF